MIEIPEGVHRVRKCSIRCEQTPWLFAAQAEREIRLHWARRSKENPMFFNGRVHIMTAGTLRQDCLEGSLAPTDFAASLYWRETGFRDPSVVDCFGSAIFAGSDGALIYGRQSPGNVNGGKIYPPGGFIDRRDISSSGAVDVDGSIAREIMEETGLDPAALFREPGYLVTRDGPLLSIGVVYRFALPGEQLCKELNGRLSKDAAPELEALVALSRAGEAAQHAMPGYARRIAMAMLPH